MRKIELYEVGPRDGFQNVDEYIPLETKIRVIDGLVRAGMKHIQITSFVSPKAIPQMKDASELAETCVAKHPDADFFALVPNLRGAQGARDAGLKWISYVVSLSESHNKANIRRTHEDSFSALLDIRNGLPDLDICLDLATAFGCPFEGLKDADEVIRFLKPYMDEGIREVNLCDTIGIADPAQMRRTIRAMQSAYPEVVLHVHVHDTRNMGQVNTLAAIELGVDRVQSTLGGLGGCPFAPGASGNLATEDLAFMLSRMGYDVNVNVDELIALSKEQAVLIPTGQFSGHMYKISSN